MGRLGPRFLADTSALARLHNDDVAFVLEPFMRVLAVATCGPVQMEMLYSSRNRADFVRRRERLDEMPFISILQRDFDRAIDVMGELARRGHHRAVAIPDLLVAAVAERAGLAVLHYDADYDLIASVTGQSMRWVVPRGTVP